MMSNETEPKRTAFAAPVQTKEDESALTPEVTTADADETIDYPATLQLVLLTIGIALGVFVIALDNTIIATAIPTITTEFNSLDDVGWYGSSYLLTMTSLQPTFGKIYTFFDVKWTYLTAIVLFEVGSTICATATNSVVLIIGRTVTGAGASALFSGGLTIIGFSVPLHKMPLYISAVSSMYGIAAIVGPILGGALTDRATWRWCFWVNLPFGGVAFFTVLLFFKRPNRKIVKLSFVEKVKELDILGAILLIGSVICLLLSLQWGGTTKPWSSPSVWGLLVGFVLLLMAFLVVEWHRGDNATIPGRILLHQRTVCTCAVYSFLMNLGLYMHLYFLPFYFQAVRGTSAEASGVHSIPYLVSMSIVTLIVGGTVAKTSHYVPFLWVGAVLFAIGSGLLFTLQIGTSTGRWIGYQILAGAGIGASTQIPFLAIQVVLSDQDMPSGNAIMMFFLTLGGALAIAIAQSIFTNALIHEIPKYTSNVDPALIAATGATALRKVVPADQLQGVLLAYSIALDRVFIFPIVTASVALIVSLFTERRTVRAKTINKPAPT